MAQFQTVMGAVLIIIALIMIAMAIYNMAVISHASTTDDDPKTTLSPMEKSGIYATNAIFILIAVILGVYGIVLLVPPKKTEIIYLQPPPPQPVPSMLSSRSYATTFGV